MSHKNHNQQRHQQQASPQSAATPTPAAEGTIQSLGATSGGEPTSSEQEPASPPPSGEGTGTPAPQPSPASPAGGLTEQVTSQADESAPAADEVVAVKLTQLDELLQTIRDQQALLDTQQKEFASQNQRLMHLESMVRKANPGTAQESNIPPLDRTGLLETKLPLVAEYVVSFTGPDADKWVQPVRVEALNGPQAVARVVKTLGLNAPAHIFQSKYLGKTWKVSGVEKDKQPEGFPRKVCCDTAENAVKLARLRTETEEELVAVSA